MNRLFVLRLSPDKTGRHKERGEKNYTELGPSPAVVELSGPFPRAASPPGGLLVEPSSNLDELVNRHSGSNPILKRRCLVLEKRVELLLSTFIPQFLMDQASGRVAAADHQFAKIPRGHFPRPLFPFNLPFLLFSIIWGRFLLSTSIIIGCSTVSCWDASSLLQNTAVIPTRPTLVCSTREGKSI